MVGFRKKIPLNNAQLRNMINKRPRNNMAKTVNVQNLWKQTDFLHILKGQWSTVPVLILVLNSSGNAEFFNTSQYMTCQT